MRVSPRVIRNVLRAGALGDAWGGQVEGYAAPTVPTPFPAVGRISDDTQLTLATCVALKRCRGVVDPAEIAQEFCRWFVQGRLSGLGSATLKALRDLSVGAHWALSGARGEYAQGAGAAMRAAPFAAVLDPKSQVDRRSLRDACRITHHSDEAYAGALAVVLAIQHAAQGLSGERMLFSVIRSLPDTAVRDRLEVLCSARFPHEAAALGTSGFVVDAVPLAIFLAATSERDLSNTIQSAVALGGDTDTIAALTAQVRAAGGEESPIALWHRIQGHEAYSATIDACWV